MEGGLLDIHLPCGELFSNTKGETLLYFKLPSGIMTLLSSHNLYFKLPSGTMTLLSAHNSIAQMWS